jgi:hypothetical protein
MYMYILVEYARLHYPGLRNLCADFSFSNKEHT